MKKIIFIGVLISLTALAVGGSIYLHGIIATFITLAIGAIFFPILILVGKTKL